MGILYLQEGILSGKSLCMSARVTCSRLNPVFNIIRIINIQAIESEKPTISNWKTDADTSVPLP